MIPTRGGARKLALLAALTGLVLVGCSGPSSAKEARFLGSGKKYLDQQDYARAILQFKNAARANAKDPEPYYQLGVTYLATGDFANAVAHLRHASEIDPKHVPSQLKLAELMATANTPDILEEAKKRAQAAAQSAPENSKESSDALAVMALAEFRLGKSQDAEQHLNQVLNKFPAHLKSSVTLANVKLAKKDYAGAETVMKQAVQQAPQAIEPTLALGRFYFLIGKTAEAETPIRRALEIDPKHGPALLDLANLQLRSGRKQQAEQTYLQLAALPDKRYKSAHAEFLFQDGQRDAAIAELEKLARENPEDRDARTRLVAAYVTAKKLNEAEQVLSAVLKKNPKDADALLQRSGIYLMNNKYAEAQNDLNGVLRFRPESGEAHYGLARVHAARGATLNQRQELTEAIRLNPKLLPARLELAQLLLGTKSARAALDLLNEAPEGQRQTPAVIAQRNWALISLNEWAEARKGIDEGLALGRSAELLLQDGFWKLQQQDYPGARTSIEASLKQNPEDIRALQTLLRTYAAEKNTPAALQRVRELVAQRPKSTNLQLFLGQMLLERGNRAEARDALITARDADSNDLRPVLALAQLDMAEGKMDAARSSLQGVLQAHPKNHTARLILAVLEDAAANYPVAIEHYRKVLETNPTDVVALNNLAFRLANNANQPDEALRLAQQAKELAPDNPAVEDTIGWAFYKKGIYRNAVTHLQIAASKSKDATMHYHLAMAYLKAGDRKRGQETLDTALKMNPNLPEAKVAQDLFREK